MRYIITSFATLSLLISGLFAAPAFAQTASDYGNGAVAGTYCPRLSQTVQRGSSGNQVLELQKFISDYYDVSPSTIETSYFGRMTQGYVMQFQKEQGLPAFGIVGSLTRAAIARVCNGNSALQTKNPVTPTCPIGQQIVYEKDNVPPHCQAIAKCQQPINVDCMPGYQPTSGGVDVSGCKLPDRCVAAIVNNNDNISVVTPNGGEQYHIGDTVTLASSGGRRSDTGGIENQYLLVDTSGNAKEIVDTGNSYSWTIGQYRDGTAIIPGTYKMRVMSSYGPCPTAACAATIQDDSDETFTITQGKNVPASGTLEGTATIAGGISYYQAILEIDKRDEKPDLARGMPYTLNNIGILEPKSDGSFSANFPPGTYWIQLTMYNPPYGGAYAWPKVTGLPTTVTIKSGEKTILNYSVDATR